MSENKKVKKFQDIIAWQKAHQLVLKIYTITARFPDTEKFGLISQMRRAAVSIVSNIVEGFARKMIKETLNFYNIANASLEELKYQILLSFDLKFINNEDNCELVALSAETGRVLQGWIDSQRTNVGLDK